ncbi:unnamed protein product [Camellia sinensis]
MFSIVGILAVVASFLNRLHGLLRNERPQNEIGLGLTAFGIQFSFLGIILFFDKGLLAMGNVRVTITIGPKSSMQFFMKRSNFKGTISFGVGFFLVVIGWPVLGMILEAYGFIVLFSGFWPTVSVFVQKIPIIGWVFQQPFVRSTSWTVTVAKGCLCNVRSMKVQGSCCAG